MAGFRQSWAWFIAGVGGHQVEPQSMLSRKHDFGLKRSTKRPHPGHIWQSVPTTQILLHSPGLDVAVPLPVSPTDEASQWSGLIWTSSTSLHKAWDLPSLPGELTLEEKPLGDVIEAVIGRHHVHKLQKLLLGEADWAPCWQLSSLPKVIRYIKFEECWSVRGLEYRMLMQTFLYWTFLNKT